MNPTLPSPSPCCLHSPGPCPRDDVPEWRATLAASRSPVVDIAQFKKGKFGGFDFDNYALALAQAMLDGRVDPRSVERHLRTLRPFAERLAGKYAEEDLEDIAVIGGIQHGIPPTTPEEWAIARKFFDPFTLFLWDLKKPPQERCHPMPPGWDRPFSEAEIIDLAMGTNYTGTVLNSKEMRELQQRLGIENDWTIASLPPLPPLPEQP